MPRGVAIPEIRQQLFAAVERVILRDGPGRLSGRAVTGEAGVATGLLYAHFSDLDDFLTGYAVDRSFTIAAQVRTLPNRTGDGEVSANLSETLLAVPADGARALIRLTAARPDMVAAARSVLGDDHVGTDAIAVATAGFLAAEQRLGRVIGGADTEALADAVAGAFGRLMLSAPPEEVAARLRRVVSALMDGVTTPTAG